MIAVARGAVPTYYMPGCSDGSVYGLYVRAQIGETSQSISTSRLLLRNPVPLQSTLFQMSESLGHELQRRGLAQIRPEELHVELGVMYAPTALGTVAQPDLEQFDVKRRALVVTEGGKSAWRYDPQLSPQQLIAVVAQQCQVTVPENAAVYSFATQSNRIRLSYASVPLPQQQVSQRPPAVAGTFYPADASDLQAMLDRLTPSEPAPKSNWRAAMVPHAGLIYSGRIAADVLRRIEFPETVIVIGPKHTANGVEWAVAPQGTWSLPGMTIENDTQLAKELSQRICGLQLDDAAHAREHAIEIELPWLARYAPHSKVVGIAIGNANLELCHRFAEELAEVLRDRLDRTLLLISSDMNHYANDAETRRVDALALEAMESLDADRLYHTVRQHRISMCGVLPACIVIDCLRRLGQLHAIERVAYGTSADTSGDRSRVVGYAGMLIR